MFSNSETPGYLSDPRRRHEHWDCCWRFGFLADPSDWTSRAIRPWAAVKRPGRTERQQIAGTCPDLLVNVRNMKRKVPARPERLGDDSSPL